MKYLNGKSVYKGMALGKIFVLKKQDYAKRKRTGNSKEEIRRIEAAREKSQEQLQELYEKALKEMGESHASIFKAHQMILKDEEFNRSVEQIIRTQKVNAEYAVVMAGNKYTAAFAEADDEYIKARAADIKDVSERLVGNLLGQKGRNTEFEEPVILVADDLTPSETVQLNKEKILAFVTVHGSANSHTAILARMMNIPALVGVDINLEEITSGTCALVDGFTGAFILEPDEMVREEAKVKIAEEKEKQKLLLKLKGKENITKSGKKINIHANVGNIEDISAVLENDAGGIGLFRSEFLYISRKELPTEEEQFQAYKQVLQDMEGKKVIIRTLDIGADKQAEYLHFDEEENPALGYRGIRICLSQPEIFKVQLRALFRASVYGNLSLMYPMITSVEEVIRIKEITEEVKSELRALDVPYNKDVEEGIMIETPAAVMISDELAELVDFFSIGTNDLTQYTLAIDRQNGKLEEFYNPYHKAVLKMIKIAVDNAHAAGKWAGICGELGADTGFTETFVNMGVDELSVAPSMILKLRKIIREME